jgi:CRISPR-associated protein (TIGR03984 family)
VTQLFASSAETISLSDAIDRHSEELGSGAVALVYSPQACSIGSLDAGVIRGAHGVLDMGTAFEARIFSTTTELRWLHVRNGEGTAVIVSEQGTGTPAFNSVDALDGTYLLWGTGTGREPAPGWSEVAESRIGALQIPLHGVPDGGRAVLRYREYIAQEDGYGNAAVVEERLMGLEVRSDV